jgi:hypothetical protein
MGAIHIDVITALDKASVAASASQLESQFGEAGRKAAEAFAANADLGGKVSVRLRQSFDDVGRQAGHSAATSFGSAF